MNRNSLLRIIRDTEIEIQFSNTFEDEKFQENIIRDLENLGNIVVKYDNLSCNKNKKKGKNINYILNGIADCKNKYIKYIEKIKERGIEIIGLPKKLNYIGIQN